MTISSIMPSALKAFLGQIEELGFSLCLVGGAPRDFLLKNKLVHDLDFEIRNLETNILKQYLEKQTIKFTELPYQILRVKFEDFDLEFSAPREEEALLDNKSHHYFKATLNCKLDYKLAFKRRDFSINAIGIELNLKEGLETIIDPYGGIVDLKQKVLQKISDDFYLDPVRFLRLIRFSIKYGFKISSDLQKNLTRFDLSELSIYHFNEEMMKSESPGAFINRFNELVLQNRIVVSSEISFIQKIKCPEELKTHEEILVFVFLNHKEQVEQLLRLFFIPEKKLKDLKSFYTSWNLIKNTLKIDLEKLASTPYSQLLSPGILSDMKNLEDKKEWRKYFSEELKFGWDKWSDIIVESKTLEEILPPMRSYYRYYLALKREFLK